MATRGSAFPCQPTVTGVLKFTPVDIWRRPFREILPRIYISMSSCCVQGYPIGRVKRIKGGVRTTNLFSFRLCRFLCHRVRIHKRACVCVEDTTWFYVSLRSTTLSSRLRWTIHSWVHTRLNSVLPPPPPFRGHGLSGSGFKKNNKRGDITGDLGSERFDLKAEDLSLFVSRKDREIVSSLYILPSLSNAISAIER